MQEGLTSAEEKTLAEKLKLMTNFDSDQQFIAACDLSDFVEKHSQRVPPALLDRIIDSLLDHLKSEIIDVHGNAIKCLSKVISKLPVQQSKRISEIMVKNVTAPAINSDIRDVYGTCVKTIINDVPQGFGDHIKELLKLTVDVLINPNGKQPPNVKIEEELVDIAGSFMKKWPKLIGKVDIKKLRFAEYLCKNAIQRDDSVLRKRSIMCAGILAASLSKQELHDLLLGPVFGKGVIGQLKVAPKTDRQSIEKRKFTLQLLCSILKALNPQVQDSAGLLGSFLKEEAAWLKQGGEQARIDKVDEILECTLQALQHLLKSIQKEAAAAVVNDQLTKLSIELTLYSPHGVLEYATTDMEQEQDEYMEDNAEDYSERVRRAALQLLAVQAKVSAKLCNRIILADQLYAPLNERNEYVVEAAFACQSQILDAIAENAANIPSESIAAALSNILKRLGQLFSCSHAYDSKIYSGAAQLICEVARRLPKRLTADDGILRQYVLLSGNSLSKAKSNEAKISLMNFIEIVAGEHCFANYRPVLGVLLSMVDHPFYKVSLAALRAVYALLEKSHRSINKDDLEFRKLLELLVVRAKKTDADQEIKHVATACVASLLGNCAIDRLKPEESEEFVKILQGKILAEVEKRHILSAICRISPELKLTGSLADSLNLIVKTVANNCLPMADQSIKGKAAEALDSCLRLLGEKLTEQNALVILSNSKAVLNEGTLAPYFERLCRLHPELISPSVSKLIGMRVPSISAIKAIYESPSARREQIVQQIVAQLQQDNLQPTIRLLSELGVTNAQIPKNANPNAELCVALKMGILGAKGDPKNFEEFVAVVLSDDQTDNIKYQASIGLGLILRNNPERLKELLQELQSKQKYMMLVGIREYARGCQSLNQPLLDMLPRLFKESGYENESILNIISECVGLIASLDLARTQKDVVSHAKCQHSNERFVFANSCRHLFARENTKVHGLENFVAPLIELARDQNLSVRSAVLRALNMIAYHEPEVLKSGVNNRQFLDDLGKLLAFDPSSVEQVQMGSVVEKIDRGKPLRLDAFSLVDTLLKRILVSDDQTVRLLIASALNTFQSDISIEVQTRRLLLVSDLLESHPKMLGDFSKDILGKLSLENTLWKEYKERKASESENAEKLLLEMLRMVLKLRLAIDDIPCRESVNALYKQLIKVPRFQNLLEELESAEE